MKSRKQKNGFTLAESMIATVIVGFAAAGLLVPFTTGASVRAEGMRVTLGTNLACDLMEQLVNTPWDALTSDWGGYTDEAQGQLKDATGELFSSEIYSGFSRGAYYTMQSGTGQRVYTVWVKHKGREVARISRIISK